MLSKPIEELELLPEDELNNLIDCATATFFITYDKSTEQIFSKNIETWKNVGNVQFIDMVGQCFSAMKQVEEYWNNRMTDANNALLEIKSHPDNYDGSSMPIKVLGDDKIRRTLNGHHYMRAWLCYTAATMRYYNRQNMKAIGISEEEVIEYTDKRNLRIESDGEVPNQQDYYTNPIAPEKLTTPGCQTLQNARCLINMLFLSICADFPHGFGFFFAISEKVCIFAPSFPTEPESPSGATGPSGRERQDILKRCCNGVSSAAHESRKFKLPPQ